jgi:hypothetical protein
MIDLKLDDTFESFEVEFRLEASGERRGDSEVWIWS